MWWPKTDRQRDLVSHAGTLADQFSSRAAAHDRAGSFPFENFADLHQSGYLALTIPRRFGGGGASILEACLAQERLARGDGSTALGASMHLSILGRIGSALEMGEVADAGGWDVARYEHVAQAVIERGALVNSAASERDTGSPSRGGVPSTRAVPTPDGGFVLNGRKTFSTMAPALGFILISASLDTDSGPAAAQFLVEGGAAGIRIEETWNTVGMRATGSHDLVLEDVRVGADALLTRRPVAPRGVTPAPQPVVEPSSVPSHVSGVPHTDADPVEPARGTPQARTDRTAGSGAVSRGAGWALLIAAVYLGIATAARDAAVQFARERRPQPLGGRSIGELPAVQRLLGEIEVALAESRALLFGVAEAWDEAPLHRALLVPQLAVAKYVVTNRGVEITDRAMRVVGGAGLDLGHPVQRYFRDIRAGLHHPPMDDVALTSLALASLDGSLAY